MIWWTNSMQMINCNLENYPCSSTLKKVDRSLVFCCKIPIPHYFSKMHEWFACLRVLLQIFFLCDNFLGAYKFYFLMNEVRIFSFPNTSLNSVFIQVCHLFCSFRISLAICRYKYRYKYSYLPSLFHKKHVFRLRR